MTLHARDAGALAMVRNAFIFSGEKSNVRDSKQLSIHLQSTEVRQLVRIANEASEIASINDFCAWTQSSVRKLFPHEALIAGLARRQNERISVEGLVSAGFPMAFIAAVTRRRGGSFACPTLEAWFRENSPQLFDPKSASIGRPTAATSEFEAYGLKNVAAHGVLSPTKDAATYFSFSQLPQALNERHGLMLELLTPHLHRAYLGARSASSNGSSGAQRNRASPRLTPREQTVLREASLEGTTKTIARALGRSHNTVKRQIGSALKKLGARDRSEAVSIAIRFGLLPDRRAATGAGNRAISQVTPTT